MADCYTTHCVIYFLKMHWTIKMSIHLTWKWSIDLTLQKVPFSTSLFETKGFLFSLLFLSLSSLLLNGSWKNGYKNPRKYLPTVNRRVPREFLRSFIVLMTSEHPLQPGRGIAIRNTARAKLLFPAHSYITATSAALYLALVTATAPAQVHSPVPAQVLALARWTAQSPVLD